jgi:chromosome partitioning protein
MLNWFEPSAPPASWERPVAARWQQPQPGANGVRPAGAANMPIIVVASQKGGSGKTTIAAHLAVQAGLKGHKPAVLIDADWQGSLSRWWRVRNDDALALATLNPSERSAIRADELAANISERGRSGFAITLIDTPPARTAAIEQIIAVADLVVIPVRPSPHDLHAVGATVDMARRRGKPFFFVINCAAPRANITVQAIAALSEHGPVAPVFLHQRVAYAASMTDGHTVVEPPVSKKAAHEIAELWEHVYSRLDALSANRATSIGASLRRSVIGRSAAQLDAGISAPAP